MKQTIEVQRPGKSPSRVVIGDVINSLENYLPEGKRVVVIADEHVFHAYRPIIGAYDYCLIGLGETNKTLATAQKLYGELLALGADRSTFILGFGGGIVTDIAGFVASTYMRGLPFGFVASTLLAQVDASVGGKNGVNFEGYKNMVGTFNQPDFVLCDLSRTRIPGRAGRDRQSRADCRFGFVRTVRAAYVAGVPHRPGPFA